VTEDAPKSKHDPRVSAADSGRQKVRDKRSKAMRCVTEAVGVRITEQRKLQRYSMRELAGRAGVNKAYLGQAERGNGNVTVEFLAKLCRVLDLSLRDLMPEEKVIELLQRAPKSPAGRSRQVKG
jgi:ribosome-binding protein aMBF1 (putative translation factor)